MYARAANHQTAEDIQITSGIVVLTTTGHGEFVQASREENRIDPCTCWAAIKRHIRIRGLDRLTQRTVAIDCQFIGKSRDRNWYTLCGKSSHLGSVRSACFPTHSHSLSKRKNQQSCPKNGQ